MEWLDAIQAAYEADKAPIDALIEAINGLTSLRHRQAELDKNEQEVAAALRAKVGMLTELWRRVHGLSELNRRGGEAEKEALARPNLLEAATQLAQLLGGSGHPLTTDELGFTMQKVPTGIEWPTMTRAGN